MGTESSVPESKDRNDKEEEESEYEETQRHVEFSIIESTDYDGSGDSNRPNKLHRRDTPHHLKNKRIHAVDKAVDKEKVASIIAQVIIIFLKKSYLRLVK